MSLLSRALNRIAAATDAWLTARAHVEPTKPLTGDEAPVINQPVDSTVDSPWTSPQFHVQQLAAEVCLCGAAKRVGSYKCSECRTVA